ncbi:hypothetical protein [Actinoplanes sp. CA-252034]|uniref:hypothetical protein n=1 Tax=Actinoplanes sp. CA-252034 TaxID=3239906 RepID=UPI003D99C258
MAGRHRLLTGGRRQHGTRSPARSTRTIWTPSWSIAAGLFVSRSLLLPPPSAPAVRDFQRAQAKALLAWLGTRRPDILRERT